MTNFYRRATLTQKLRLCVIEAPFHISTRKVFNKRTRGVSYGCITANVFLNKNRTEYLICRVYIKFKIVYRLDIERCIGTYNSEALYYNGNLYIHVYIKSNINIIITLKRARISRFGDALI